MVRHILEAEVNVVSIIVAEMQAVDRGDFAYAAFI
jgi:hypothetical protein